MNSASYTPSDEPENTAGDASEAHSDSNEGGIIEKVLRRSKAGRDLVVWEGVKVTPSKELLLAHDPYHPHSERLRSLRTEILIRAGGRSSAAFALVSAEKGEGRSRLSAELALAFAQLGGKTLLVDADLRHPRQHELFETGNDTGLAQALTDGKAAVFHRVEGVPHMALITSGATPPNPLELLCSIQFQHLVSEWQRTYQYVIIDTPPSAASSDAIAVATTVGQVVILGRTKVTPLRKIKELRDKLQTSHAEVIGAVMNDF